MIIIRASDYRKHQALINDVLAFFCEADETSDPDIDFYDQGANHDV